MLFVKTLFLASFLYAFGGNCDQGMGLEITPRPLINNKFTLPVNTTVSLTWWDIPNFTPSLWPVSILLVESTNGANFNDKPKFVAYIGVALPINGTFNWTVTLDPFTAEPRGGPITIPEVTIPSSVPKTLSLNTKYAFVVTDANQSLFSEGAIFKLAAAGDAPTVSSENPTGTPTVPSSTVLTGTNVQTSLAASSTVPSSAERKAMPLSMFGLAAGVSAVLLLVPL